MEQRMVAEVRKADFVVVNPDHIAVALRYDRDGDAAPVVVASGERLLAERIKQVARESGVPIFRDVTLARSLRGLPEGEEIPAALYEAVAEVLRVVYGMTEPAAAATPAQAATAPEAPAVPRGAGWKRA
jgi:flagellar biosynthetic protein FlhB